MNMRFWKRHPIQKTWQNAKRSAAVFLCHVFPAETLSNGDLRMGGHRHFYHIIFLLYIIVSIGNRQSAGIFEYDFGMPTSIL